MEFSDAKRDQTFETETKTETKFLRPRPRPKFLPRDLLRWQFFVPQIEVEIKMLALRPSPNIWSWNQTTETPRPRLRPKFWRSSGSVPDRTNVVVVVSLFISPVSWRAVTIANSALPSIILARQRVTSTANTRCRLSLPSPSFEFVLPLRSLFA